MAKGWTHITTFDREYPKDVQAEGIAVHEAVAEQHCNRCVFIARCVSDDTFRPPFFAWCQARKKEILKSWEERNVPTANLP